MDEQAVVLGGDALEQAIGDILDEMRRKFYAEGYDDGHYGLVPSGGPCHPTFREHTVGRIRAEVRRLRSQGIGA